MACTSGSVQKVADKTAKAAEHIKILDKMLTYQHEDIQQQFNEKIESI